MIDTRDFCGEGRNKMTKKKIILISAVAAAGNGTMLYLDGHAEAMELVNRDLPTAAGYWFPMRDEL